jgi:uncharacterized UPF0160 family protein
MVAALNPAWNVPCTDSEIDQRFEKASILMGEAFLSKLDFYGKSWLPARSIVVDALSQRKTLDSKGRILHLPQFCPWKVSPHHPPVQKLSRKHLLSALFSSELILVGTFV